jgi:hypothetical protein
LAFADDDQDADFDVEDLEEERRAFVLNSYPQFDSKGEIGSVHTSSVRLRVSETNCPGQEPVDYDPSRLPESRRRISSSRVNMKTCGGQGYLPIVKSNTLTDQRCNLESVLHLPLLLQRVLTSPQGSFDQDKSTLLKDTIEKFARLKSLLDDISCELKATGKNTVRFEFFVTSTLRNADCDITLPVPDPRELLSVIDHTVFKEYWTDYVKVYQVPLGNFVEDLSATVANRRKAEVLVSAIPPSIRTCLVLCAEKCVQAANIMGFQGRIIQVIWNELRHVFYKKDFFILPATVVVEFSEPKKFQRYALHKPKIASVTLLENGELPTQEDEDGRRSREPSVLGMPIKYFHSPSFFLTTFLLTDTDQVQLTSQVPARTDGEFYALHPTVFGILLRDEPLKLAESHLRSPPRFLQTNRGQLHKVLNCPFPVYRLLAKMHAMALRYTDPDESPIAYGTFEEPDYQALAQMQPAEVEKFMTGMCEIIWEGYHIEWWFIIKERAYQRKHNTQWDGFDNVDLALGSFPSTVSQYKAWVLPQLANPLLEPSTKFNNGRAQVLDSGTCEQNFSMGTLVQRLLLTLTFFFRRL